MKLKVEGNAATTNKVQEVTKPPALVREPAKDLPKTQSLLTQSKTTETKVLSLPKDWLNYDEQSRAEWERDNNIVRLPSPTPPITLEVTKQTKPWTPPSTGGSTPPISGFIKNPDGTWTDPRKPQQTNNQKGTQGNFFIAVIGVAIVGFYFLFKKK